MAKGTLLGRKQGFLGLSQKTVKQTASAVGAGPRRMPAQQGSWARAAAKGSP